MKATKGLAALAGTVALLAGSATQASAAAEPASTSPLASAAAYSDYLKHSDEEGALDTLKEFQALTADEQSRFLGYLQNPSLYKEFLTAGPEEQNDLTAFAQNTSSTASSQGGDITYEAKSTVSALKAGASKPLPKGDHTVKRSNKIKVLGVTVIEFKIWETFHSNGRTITKVISADGGKKNFSVAVSISKGVPKTSLGSQRFCKRGSTCVSGRTAVASIVWEGSAVVSGGTIQVDKKQTLTSNVYGTASSSLQNV
ncbi:hypothetical protein [Streptomyces sp. NPDC004830]